MNQLQQQVLDHIASGEGGNSYNVLFGGHQFKSFHDHPRLQIPIPGTGQVSTAAGRYQMLAPTWDAQAKRLGLKDFSPASQDAAAWDLANRTYQQVTGRDLSQDALRQQVDYGALSNQWTSLRKGLQVQSAKAGPGATVLPPDLAPIPGNSLELAASPTAPSLPLPVGLLMSSDRTVAKPAAPRSAYLRAIDYDPFEKKDTSQ